MTLSILPVALNDKSYKVWADCGAPMKKIMNPLGWTRQREYLPCWTTVGKAVMGEYLVIRTGADLF